MTRSARRTSAGRRGVLAAALLAPLAGCANLPMFGSRAAKQAALSQLGFVQRPDGDFELSLGVLLLFETDVDIISSTGRAELRRVAQGLTRIGVDRVRVEGHTDNIGTERYNYALSLRRAESVAQELVAAGIRPKHIERIGHGFDKPLADNATPEGRAQNRRVAVVVRVD